MPLAFQQPDIGVTAETDIKIAVGRSLLGETHVAGVKPIIAAGGDNLLSAGRGRHRRRLGKTRKPVRRENPVGDPDFAGKDGAGGAGRRGIIRPDIRPQVFRQGIEIRRAIRLHDFADIADGVQKIAPFRQRKLRCFAGEFLQRRVRPEQHGKFSELGGFFEKPQVAGLDVVEPAADNDLWLRGHFRTEF